MRVEYDDEADAACIYMAESIDVGGVAKTHCCDPSEVGGMINLDFDEDGRLLGIEVLRARAHLPPDLQPDQQIELSRRQST